MLLWGSPHLNESGRPQGLTTASAHSFSEFRYIRAQPTRVPSTMQNRAQSAFADRSRESVACDIAMQTSTRNGRIDAKDHRPGTYSPDSRSCPTSEHRKAHQRKRSRNPEREAFRSTVRPQKPQPPNHISSNASRPGPGFPLWDNPQKVRGMLTQQTMAPRGIASMLRYRPPIGCCRMIANEPFSHRTNKDGTIDSICARCYLTVGTAWNESELPKIEHSHTCNPDWLFRWQLLSR